MATYKQKPIRYQTHYPTSDSEEASTSETDWTAFGTSTKTVGRATNASQNTSEDDDWNVLSDTAGLASSGSGFSDIAQEEVIYFPENTSDSHTSGLTRLMPSHDGTGNFTSSPLAEALNSVSFSTQSSNSTSLLALQNRWQRGRLFGKASEFDFDDILSHNTNTVDASSEKENKVMSPLHPSNGSFSSSHKINQDDVTPVSEYNESVNFDERAPGFSPLPASTNIISEISFIPPDRRQSTSSENSMATTTQKISLYQTPTSRSNERPRRISFAQLFNLSSSLANKDNDLGTPEEHPSSMVRLMVPSDPMEINFSPTIEGTLNDNRQPQNLSSEPSHSPNDESSLLSTVWTSFRRFTSSIINAEFESYNDNSQQTSVPPASSYSQHHLSGLASIINGTGENNYTYDACYLPFGNHLTLSELGYSERGGSRSSRYNSKYQYSPFSKSSKNSRPSILTPASSSTSLKSFFSRSGSDCGLEIGRDMASNIQFENKCK